MTMIANTSKKQYLTTYRNLIKKADSDSMEDIYKFIKDASVKDTTKQSYLNSIISLKKYDSSLVKGDLKDIVDFRDKLNVKIDDNRKTNNISDKQRKALETVNMNNIATFLDKLKSDKDKSPKNLENYILIYLMSKYPIRNDLQEIYITNYKSDTNHPINSILIPAGNNKKAKLYLKEYKTSKTNGDIVIELDTEITKDIKKLIKDERKYLFQNSKGEALSSSLFTHKLNRLFNKEFGIPVSSTILRKIYLTDKYKDVIGEMAKDAQIMGHSMDTQRDVYVDNKKKE
jgi:integrase